MRWAGALLLVALIIFFSDYQFKIPLLAQTLGGIGLVFLVKGLLDSRPRNWTYIYDDDGNFVTALEIDNNETDDRKQQRLEFEHSLSEAIEVAKQQEYYDWG